jgi:hypothetical protein
VVITDNDHFRSNERANSLHEAQLGLITV